MSGLSASFRGRFGDGRSYSLGVTTRFIAVVWSSSLRFATTTSYAALSSATFLNMPPSALTSSSKTAMPRSTTGPVFDFGGFGGFAAAAFSFFNIAIAVWLAGVSRAVRILSAALK